MKATMPTLAAGLEIDVARLIDTRLLVQSNSGGGKSWALRRLRTLGLVVYSAPKRARAADLLFPDGL